MSQNTKKIFQDEGHLKMSSAKCRPFSSGLNVLHARPRSKEVADTIYASVTYNHGPRTIFISRTISCP